MATKLMRRWSQVQKVSSFLCMRTNVVSTGGKMASARVLPQIPFASLSSCNLPRQTDKVSVKEQAGRVRPEQGELENFINTSSSVEDLLQLEDLFAINGHYSAMTITRLSLLVAEKKLDPSSILKDPHFLKLLRILNKQLSLVSNASLVRAWKSLCFLGMDPSKHEMQSIKQELCWRLRRLTYKQLTTLAEHVAAGPSKEEPPDEFLSNLLRHLELRWTEIEDPKILGTLMNKLGGLSPTLMERLEDKGLELVEQFSAEDIRKVSMALAFQKRRSVPLLRAISYHVVQKHMTLSTRVLLDMAFAYGKLNFPQNQMFQKIAADLCPRVPQLVPEDVVRCIKSFAYVKTSNPALFEAFAQYTVDNASRFTPEHLSNIVLAFARLNFHPSSRDAFYSAVHKGLEGHLDAFDPYLLVDMVWSLCVLQEAKPAYLQKILTPAFHTRFLGTLPAKASNYGLKLIQINSAAKLECEEYKGPFLPPEALGGTKQLGAEKQTPSQNSLKEALEKVAGEPSKVRFKVDTVWGWQLDAEMLVNSEDQPLVVAEFVAPHLTQSEGSKPLPTGARRFAFLRWEFPNFICQGKDLLGRFVMARRHLQVAGFLVVDVPYYEWLELKTDWQKASYLRDRMNKAVAEEMAK